METPAPLDQQPSPYLRDYLAEERTFLAWIRTGLTLMGFGFVVARFGLFLRVMQMTQGDADPHRHGLSPWFGTAFIVCGVAVNLLAIRQHVLTVRVLNRGELPERGLSWQAVVLALFLAIVGGAMAVYLILQ
jgi:putative membrane protein